MRSSIGSRLAEIIAETAFASATLFRLILKARSDLAEPLAMIVVKRGEGNAVMDSERSGRGLPPLVLLPRVEVGIRKEKRHAMTVRGQSRHTGGRTRPATGVQHNGHAALPFPNSRSAIRAMAPSAVTLQAGP